MTKQEQRVVILGGGPCGLGAAVRLTELDHPNWTLYELEDRVGGLSRSIPDDKGFLWDIGGHVIFSHYKYFDDVLEYLGPAERVTLTRKCLVFMQDGQFEVNYPLQNHVDELPPDLWQPCLDGLLDSYVASQLRERRNWKPNNFAEWANGLMGAGLVTAFLRPYNEKLWAWPMETMSADWLGERVAVPDFKKVLAKFTHHRAGQPREAKEEWGPNSVFKFALEGGTGAIWSSVGDHLPKDRLKVNMTVSSIDPDTRTVTFKDGSTDNYDILINTISLQTVARDLLVHSYSKKVLLQELTSKLRFCSVVVVGLGIQGPEPERLDRFHWGYFPALDVPFYRCTVLSHYSPKLVPPADENGNYYSLLFESSYSAHRPQQYTQEELFAATEDAARRYSLVDDNVRVVSRWTENFHFGYPTPTTDRDSLLREIHSVLEPQNIYSRGRFGGWKYEVGNMDHSLMQGVEVVDRVLQPGSPLSREPTYNTPNFTNDPANRGTVPLRLDAVLSRQPTKPAQLAEDLSAIPTTDAADETTATVQSSA